MPKKIILNTNNEDTSTFLRKRELGFRRDLGYDDKVAKKLITSLEFYSSREETRTGGIFNLEFSLDGSILGAACEKKSFVLYDALNQKSIKSVEDAHSNCVNCLRFIDNKTFATGSDDNTVKTWDIRFLKTATRTLCGHSNWVKNIEYSSREHRLITSSFDGGIYSWDLNNFTEQGVIYEKVFFMDGLMRMKLAPDSSKIIVCTTQGYMLLIHDVNLKTLNNDLQKFKPNIYRLMQESEQNIPIASCVNNLFSPYRKFNRVELISDFKNCAEVISSLQIHPMGWCALSRNINNDEMSEWTSVHDIQERPIDEYLHSFKTVKVAPLQPNLPTPENNIESRQTPMDLWMGFISNQNIRTQRMIAANSRRGTGIRTTRASVTIFNSGILSSESEPNTEEGTAKIIQNLPRLTHFMEEPNVGKGFIKELCFSGDGRVICSPYHAGIRLFAFSESCSELSTCVPKNPPQRLCQVAQFKDYHSEIVVSCKFNPYHCSLVSGCLGGQIVWYQPVF